MQKGASGKDSFRNPFTARYLRIPAAKRTLGLFMALAMMTVLLPVGVLADVDDPLEEAIDYTDGLGTGYFKGNGAYVYDSASTDEPLTWVSSGQTLYLDEAKQHNGWIMVYYEGGEARGWAKLSRITRS